MKSSPNCKAEIQEMSRDTKKLNYVCSSGRRAYESLTRLVLINANRANNSRLYQPKYAQAYY